MKQPQVPDFYSELIEQPLNRLVDEAQDAGKKALGYTCSYVPEPMLNVDGLFSVRLRAPGVSGTPMADTYLSSVICSYTRSILEYALDFFYDNLDGWVFVSSCDHMRRLYDNLEYVVKPSFLHIMDVPHRSGEAAVKWQCEELRMLAERLAAEYGVDMGEESLRESIKRHNEYLALLRDLAKLRRRENPPLTGTQFHGLLTACMVSPKWLVMDKLRSVVEQLKASDDTVSDYRARLLLAGSNCDDPEYVRLVESVGGLVVADRTCTGSIPALRPVAEEGEPYENLARHTLSNISCPRMMEAHRDRVEEIREAYHEYKADGVVLQTMKFCDTWGVESSPIVAALRESGVPVLRLEREYGLSGEGQLTTRVQAFLESLGK
ncbi:MAG: 2-hydroxyacyl-CoA dehydratase subunit D [Desulfatibacillaceae bacterium]